MKIRFMVILFTAAAFILTMSFVGRAQTSELLTASAWWGRPVSWDEKCADEKQLYGCHGCVCGW